MEKIWEWIAKPNTTNVPTSIPINQVKWFLQNWSSTRVPKLHHRSLTTYASNSTHHRLIYRRKKLEWMKFDNTKKGNKWRKKKTKTWKRGKVSFGRWQRHTSVISLEANCWGATRMKKVLILSKVDNGDNREHQEEEEEDGLCVTNLLSSFINLSFPSHSLF